MKTIKMSLENLTGKMSRSEMKELMAGSDVCANKSITCHGRLWSCAEEKFGMCYNSYCDGYCK